MRNYFAKLFQRKKPEEEIIGYIGEEKVIKGTGEYEKFKEFKIEIDTEFFPRVNTMNPATSDEVNSIISTLPKIDQELEKKVRVAYAQKKYKEDYQNLVDWIHNTWKEDYLLIEDIQKHLWPKKSYYEIRYQLRKLKRDGYFVKNQGKIMRLSEGKWKKVIWVLNLDKPKIDEPVKKLDDQDLKEIKLEIQQWRKNYDGQSMPNHIWLKLERLSKKYSFYEIIRALKLKSGALNKLRKFYKEGDPEDIILQLYNKGWPLRKIAKEIGTSRTYVANYLHNRKLRIDLSNSIKDHVDSVLKKSPDTPVQVLSVPRKRGRPLGSKGKSKIPPLHIIKPDGTKITIRVKDSSEIPQILKKYCK